MKIIYALLPLVLSGCASTKPLVEQQNLLVKCQELPDLKGTTGKDVLDTMTTWGFMYAECRERHSALVDTLQSLSK